MDERVTLEMFEQLRRAIVAIAYATISATDSDGDLTMDTAHRESVMLAVKPLVAGMTAGGPASGSVANAGTTPGERSTSEYTPEEIAIADSLGKLRVDNDGLGWISGLKPGFWAAKDRP